MMLDSLGKRYGCLPSTVLAQGDTLDIVVLNTAAQWEKHCEQHQGKDGRVPPMIPEQDLQGMIDRVRNRSSNEDNHKS